MPLQSLVKKKILVQVHNYLLYCKVTEVAEVLLHGGPGTIDVLTVVCQKMWTMAEELETVTDYSSSEKRRHTT